MPYIAIDLGTSYLKGAVVDVEQLTLTQIRRGPAPALLPAESALIHELNAEAVVHGVRQLISELLKFCQPCQGILLCGQMGGLILTRPDGTALSSYISWTDGRLTAPHSSGDGTWFDHFADDVGGSATAQRLGNEFRPGLPLPFLYWLRQNNRLALEPFVPLTLPDFVAASLCHATPVMERTLATSLLDVSTGTFPLDLADRLHLSHLQWPELVDFHQAVGTCQINGQSVPVYAPVGDHQCSVAGTLLTPVELSINIATGSQVAVLTSDSEVGSFQLRPYFDRQYLKTITNIPAGRALTAIIRLLTEIPGRDGTETGDAWDYFFRQADTTRTSDVEVNLAFFPGAIAGPGSIRNLREDNLNVGSIARSALTQMADYYSELTSRIVSGSENRRVVFAGGIAQKSALLRSLIMDRLGGEFRLTTSTEDALLGLMVLGRVTAGLNASVADATAHIARHLPTSKE